MKFDFIIGNPPYQDETLGDNKGFAPPIYHKFLENAYGVGNVVEMIKDSDGYGDKGGLDAFLPRNRMVFCHGNINPLIHIPLAEQGFFFGESMKYHHIVLVIF